MLLRLASNLRSSCLSHLSSWDFTGICTVPELKDSFKMVKPLKSDMLVDLSSLEKTVAFFPLPF
jgi:hypothetical protein